MNWKKILGAALTIAAVATTVTLGIAYSDFASDQIYKESVTHLDEIYSQINSTFRTTISKNWRLLGSWRYFVTDTADSNPEEFIAFIEDEKADWHFTTFYFLSEDGNYITYQGDEGYINLGESLDRLVDGRENIVVDGTLPTAEQITIFAVPIEPGKYCGFDYTAIAVSFNSDDMTSSLNIDAFSGESDCFVTYADGRVLFSSKSGKEQPYNFLSHLRSNGNFTGKNAEDIAQDWQNGIKDVVLCELDGIRHYVIYQPVGFSNWVFVSIAPAAVVNSGMNRFTYVTMAAMGTIFMLFAASVIGYIISKSRKRASEQNREIKSREKLLDLLTQNTDEIFIMFSPKDFRAEYVSSNLERVLGISPKSIAGDVRELLFAEACEDPDDDSRHLTEENLKSVPMDDVWTTVRTLEHQKTHEPRWFKELLYHCSLEKEERFILLLSDRTKERRMNEALEDSLNVAKAANEAKSSFLANMSHDIRTPMNAIVGFSVLLTKDAEKPEKVRQYTRKITSSSQHLLSLINDILDMSKIESGKTSLNLIEFSLPELIDELYTMILPQARAKKQDFELYTKGGLPEFLLGDKLRLNQVLINLLSNAVKYTQDGGQITLTVQGLEQKTASNAHLRFIVEDNGFGMSEGFVKTIFDPFAREVTESTKEIQGTGLGMAITKNIIDLMGGTISVQSQLEHGSTFTIELEMALANPDEHDSEFWMQHSITRMLIVDDDEDICRDIVDAMEGTGVSTLYATEGIKAVEIAEKAHNKGEGFHIILLDWKMPHMNGIETAREIRSRTGSDVPIFVLTSYDLEAAEHEGRDVGIDMFIPKPFFLSSFRRAVSKLLDKESDVHDLPRNADEISLSGLKVLAAEDNEINAEILHELLAMEGMTCEIAVNGQEAFERFQQSAPGDFDFIFMDVQMPVMNGYEATRAIRSGSHPCAGTIPIVAMTANAFEEDVKAALDAGMNAHIAKPIDMTKMKIIIDKFRSQHN